MDEEAYALDAWFPAEPVVVAAEAWARDQRLVRIEVYPLQYNPARGILRIHEDLTINLRFGNSEYLQATGQNWPGTGSALATGHALVNGAQSASWPSAIGTESFKNQIQGSGGTFQSLGERYEIIVSNDGIYQISYSELQAAGMDVDAINPQSFHLFNHGLDVSIYVEGEGDTSFDSGDFVQFYGQRFRGDILADRYEDEMTVPLNDPYDVAKAPNNWFWQCIDGCDLDGYFEKFTDDNIYYLTVGGAAGPRMASVDGTAGGATILTEYQTTVRAEESKTWWSYEYYDEDVWFWNRLTGVNVTKTSRCLK